MTFASTQQIAAFTELYRDNYRPTQPLGERAIDGAHFDYAGADGPMHWGELARGWELCEEGQEQSPIDIPADAKPAASNELTIDYRPATLEIENTGHTIQVDYEPGSAIAIHGSKYQLTQFHFHAHSEHSIAGHLAPLEVHLVHRSQSGALAVIGVLIEEGEPNRALDAVFTHLPERAGPPSKLAAATIDAAQLLPEDRAMWRYEGSLTTPPCSENVKWHVLASPIHASSAQIAAFTALYRADARPQQPLGGRPMY